MNVTVALAALFVGLILPLGFEVLPSGWLMLALAVSIVPLASHRLGRIPAVLIVGFLWAAGHHHIRLEQRLPSEFDGQRFLIEGRVAGLPEPTENGWRFEVDRASPVETGLPLPRIRAQWFRGEPVAAGEQWRFEAVLRRPRGMSNPGAFDYESWLYAQNIGALASIRSGERLDAGGLEPLAGQRSRLRDALAEKLAAQGANGRVLALVVGDRSVLSRHDWELMQATGTSHLMVISGLHVGMLAAAVFLLVKAAGRLGLASRRWPRLWFAAVPAALVSALYAALAGFAVPTQRALLMVVLALLARLLYRQPSPWTLWLGALAMVTLIEPAAPLRAGFWLSFMAVGMLLFGLGGRLRIAGAWARWGRPQWVIFLGLWPWLLLWGMPGSVVAPIVNLVAIPWVAILVVPLALVGSLMAVLLDLSWVLWLADLLLDWLFVALEYLASDIKPLRWAFPGWINWSLGTLGLLVLLSPLARQLWLPATVCLVALAYPRFDRPSDGQLWATFLDVGQGLSVLLQTREHSLLYDAGARLHTGFDLGEAVVLPALTAEGLRALDLMLLSHADNDHAGGAPAVYRQLRPSRVIAGQYEDLPLELNAEPCVPGEAWDWNGVGFKILYSAPPPAPPNERSCILRVRAGPAGVLLTGDLGIRGEYQMLGLDLDASILLAPHHGSRSSSSYALIRAVDPEWVVFSAGHGNRYNHPHPQIVDRYRELGVEPVYTSRSGATRFVLDQTGARVDRRWRNEARRFWHEK
jgi:competence protein ComEC